MLNLRWVGIVSGAFLILGSILTLESQTHGMAIRTGLEWATKERLPCPGLIGSLTALPLFTAMGARMEHSPPGSVVMLGDSTFTSSPGCGQGELPLEQTFQYALKSALGTMDVMNFGLWAADWPVLSRQTALLRLVQKSTPAPRTFVVLSNLPLPVGHLHPVLFAQTCHHVTCDRLCRALCAEEAESRSEGAWPFFRYLPFLAEPVAGMASFTQTFITAAPMTARPVQMADRLGWSTILSARSVTARYENEVSKGIDPDRVARWRAEGDRQFPRAISLLRAGWHEGALLQLWYKEWLRQLRSLKGNIVFVSQKPNPAYLAKSGSEDRLFMEAVRNWLDREALRILPESRVVTLDLPSDAYVDAVHWSPEGAARAARSVAEAIRALPAQGEPM